MSCLCEPNTLVCVPVNPCNAGTIIGVRADEAGTWTANIEFNGAARYFGLEVEEDEYIVLPTMVLNENYIHQIKFNREDGTEFGCYKLQTQLTQSVSGSPVPPVSSGSWDYADGNDDSAFDVVNSDTITSDYLKGELAPILWQDSQSLEWAEFGIVWDGAAGTLVFPAAFTGSVVIQYRNLP